MAAFAEYSASYETVAMRREDGILEVRLHTGEGPLRWGAKRSRTRSCRGCSTASHRTRRIASSS
jgi:hypothetical protein